MALGAIFLALKKGYSFDLMSYLFGNILGVTPRISPEGKVVMEIDAEKSDVNYQEGQPISVQGTGMGDELDVARGTALTARIQLWAEDALRSVEIISEGRAPWGSSFAQPDVDVSVPLGAAGRSTHYYVRALQRDGGIVYASPVFVNVT